MSNVLQFAPLNSAVEAVFWHDLGTQKVNHYKLDDSPKPIFGFFTTGTDPSQPARLCVGTKAFDVAPSNAPPYHFPSPGTLRNTNTSEAFRDLDKKELLATAGQEIWEDIVSGRALKAPWLLTRFVVLTFADLKKYKYKYWFAFPALVPASPFTVTSTQPIATIFSGEQQTALCQAYEALRGLPASQGDLSAATAVTVRLDPATNKPTIHPLAELSAGVGAETYVLFADACALSSHPGWHLRNLLVMLRVCLKLDRVKVICYREQCGKNDISLSIVLDIDMNMTSDLEIGQPCPKVLGWEKNEQDKLQPRFMDLAAMMDPKRLAETSADLNLKLMRWRQLPSLNLEIVSTSKCLLFGAGTLGCNVARTLMGWGVRHITLIDNGKVSFSNPARQSLFTFEDCLDGGKPKAVAAAEALKRIFPSMVTLGLNMSVPMPGHVVTSEEQTTNDVALIEKLIVEHDVVFLLMDTRESRWLPTMLCALHNKMCINAALGFDTFMVMRHGAKRLPDHATKKEGAELGLGCYFCNDVVAPTDSMSDRTLDQQCTVTRPGLSFVASALAVELMVSLLNHPLQHAAPADLARSPSDPVAHDLGLLPHQIRGYFTHFANLLVFGQCYSKCTACSTQILDLYRSQGIRFLMKAFNEPKYLEDVTGLTALHKETESAVQEWEATDDDDF